MKEKILGGAVILLGSERTQPEKQGGKGSIKGKRGKGSCPICPKFTG